MMAVTVSGHYEPKGVANIVLSHRLAAELVITHLREGTLTPSSPTPDRPRSSAHGEGRIRDVSMKADLSGAPSGRQSGRL
jgi:hypothetical protein